MYFQILLCIIQYCRFVHNLTYFDIFTYIYIYRYTHIYSYIYSHLYVKKNKIQTIKTNIGIVIYEIFLKYDFKKTSKIRKLKKNIIQKLEKKVRVNWKISKIIQYCRLLITSLISVYLLIIIYIYIWNCLFVK